MSKSTSGTAAVFLDRDGTIVHEAPNYITSPEELELIEGAGQALRQLQAAGYKLVVTTNQSCLAKGVLDEKTLEKIHERLESLLAEEAVQLDGIYFCGDHPGGNVEPYNQDSERRKPGAGMLLEAAEELGIDLSESWMVGDATRDAQAGSSAGCRTILLTDPEQIEKGRNGQPDLTAADFAVKNLPEAADIIIAQDIGAGELPEVSRKKTKSNGPSQEDSAKVLSDILREMRHQRVAHKHLEFPVSKMLAGMLQCIVFLCLILTYVALSYWSDRAIFVCLGVGLILQVMVVALLLVQRSN